MLDSIAAGSDNGRDGDAGGTLILDDESFVSKKRSVHMDQNRNYTGNHLQPEASDYSPS